MLYLCTTRTRQASQRCSNVRVVLFYTMNNRVPFQKSYTSARDLVCLLQSRGLTVTDPAKAGRYLEFIGYYRLSAYMYPLLQIPKEQHRYKPNTTFSQVIMLYRFDKKLRLLIFNEIEKIEVAVRSAIVNIGSDMMSNPFWMTDSSNFIDAGKFRHTMDLIDAELHRSREDFIVHFKHIGRSASLRCHYQHLQQHQDRPNQEEYCTQIWLASGTLRIVAYHRYTDTQLLLSPCTRMEQAEHHPSDASQPHSWQLDNSAHRYASNLL